MRRIYCACILLTLFSRAVHGQGGSYDVHTVSSCQQLREILELGGGEKRIIITKNIRCEWGNWRGAVAVTRDVVIEGSKFGEGVPAIDWADLTDGFAVHASASLTFQNLVLLTEFIQPGGLRLSFAAGAEGASVRLLGTGIGVRSCPQKMDDLRLDQLPRPISGTQIIEARHNDAVFVENLAFVPSRRDDNSSWIICKSLFQCSVNSPFQGDFQAMLNQETLESNCAAAAVNALAESETGVSSGSTSNSNFAVIVAIFTALCTTLVLIFVFVVFKVMLLPLMRKKKKPKQTRDIENATPRSASGHSKERRKSRSRSRQTSSVSFTGGSLHLTDIELGVPLGKGSLSTVYKGYHNDKPLAVKLIDLEGTDAFNTDEDPISVYLAQRLWHVHVVDTLLYQTHRMEELQRSITVTGTGTEMTMNTIGSFADTTLSSITELHSEEPFQYRTVHVMEFCNLGTLDKAMMDGVFFDADRRPRLLMLLKTALDIAKGMRHLHSARMIHGQLRPSNVLLKGDATDARGFVCKISDFGLMHLQERQHALELTQGHNLAYRAPETLRKGTIEAGSDVYAFGMVLWSMLSGKKPFGDFEAAEIVSTVLEGTRPEIPATAPRRYVRLIKDCWHADKTARPPFSNIIERLGRIIAEVVRVTESPNSSPKHHRSQKSACSSTTDGDTVVNGSIVNDVIFDTVEIHDTNSEAAFPTPSARGSVFKFVTTVTSPMSTKSDVVFPSFDPASQSPAPQRYCLSWDAANSGELSGTISEADPPPPAKPERQNPGAIVSKPSETVSLRYGMASDSIASEQLEDLSSDPSLT